MLTVHVRINDAATGKPTPARARFVDAAGKSYAPFGRLQEFATGPGEAVGGSVRLGSETWHYFDGACEIQLPPGPLTVEICKGPEYAPLRRPITLGPGQMALRFALERWADLRKNGWFTGDTRAHFLSPPAALLEAAAEDLAVVNILAQEVPATATQPGSLPDLLAFSGTKQALEQPGHAVVVNTFNVHPVLGTVSLLNSHRPVYPLRFGADAGPDNWSVADWCDQCHRKKGLVVWPDIPRLTAESPQGEALAALLLGKIDAFEICRFADPEPAVLSDYYRLLDCGLRLPLVGGSGKDRNTIALGAVRTAARLGLDEPYSYASWIEAIRAGRSFITNGPLLTFTVDGQEPGAILAGPASGKLLQVRVEAQSSTPFAQVEVLANGNIVASKTASGNRQSAVLEASIDLKQSGWLAARCWGRDFMPGGDSGQVVFAHSSPIYLQLEGSKVRPDTATVSRLYEVLDQTIAWVAKSGRFETDKQRDHLNEVLEAGRRELEKRHRP